MIVGIDGCRAGWLYVARGDDGVIGAGVVEELSNLVANLPGRSVVAIDVPIGLPSAGSRACDDAVRLLLGRRRASVFAAPVRSVLPYGAYAQASAQHRASDGRGLSRQTFNILPKVREVDALLADDASLRERVREAHPELSFALMAGAPMPHTKRSAAGSRERQAALEHSLPGVVAQVERRLTRGGWQRDDLLDACALLWSAARIASGEALRVPELAPLDATGLRMQICG